MAHARNTDPQTSHDAAASVTNVTETKRAILNLLQNAITDDELIDRFYEYMDSGLVRHASPSGIRSRRKELVDAGLVYDTGLRGKTPSGRSSIIWLITDAGKVVAGWKAW